MANGERMPSMPWELDALKKAIHDELEGCVVDVSESPPPRDINQNAEDSLRQILGRWNTDLEEEKSAGPSFLVHIQRSTYNGDLNFATLTDEDNMIIGKLRRAAPSQAFHTFLGRLYRTAFHDSVVCGEDDDTVILERPKYSLQDLVHDGGRKIVTYPSIDERDLLDERYFDGLKEDKFHFQFELTWTRIVSDVDLIIYILPLG
jgi:hypothetical protein